MSLISLAIVLTAIAVTSAFEVTPQNAKIANEFLGWANKYNKQYANSQLMSEAFANFKASAVRVARKNVLAQGKTTFGLTKFADLTFAQFKARYLTARPPAVFDISTEAKVFDPSTHADPPTSFDWRFEKRNNQDVISYVKDQGQCGSCWAFSITEAVESAQVISNTGALLDLSPQQVVDCDTADQGCDGGWPLTAYQYIQAKGQETDDDYPYYSGTSGSAGTCAYTASKVAAKLVPGPTQPWIYGVPPCNDSCTKQDENALAAAVYNMGPLSVCVDATDDWQDYTGGILFGFCPSDFDDLNHCVQLTGYDSDTWFVRNSWGGDWGQEGYIMISRGDNQCGIADLATFPVTK